MKKSLKKNSILTTLMCVTTILLIFSCTGIETKINASVKPKPSNPPPVIVLLDTCPPPKKVSLKTATPPHVVRVPKVPGGFYIQQTESGEEKIQLLPPAIIPAKPPIANFTNFNTEQGLALGYIPCGWLDKRGLLWFSTGNSVCYYDGSSFTNFNIGQTSNVWAITEEKNGNLWFGSTGGGATRFDGVHFTQFTTRNGLISDIVLTIKQDKKGDMWFGTIGGVSRFDGSHFTNFKTEDGLLSNYVNVIIEDKKGNIWFGTNRGGVSCYDGTRFKNFTKKEGLPDNNVNDILDDEMGNLWFCTRSGVSRFDGTQFSTFNTGNGLTSNNVTSIAVDKTGNLWFGTLGGGACFYDGHDFISFTTEQGLANNNIMDITKDEKGNLWFCTMGGGLSRYNGPGVKTFTSKQGLAPTSAYGIKQDKNGNLWIATYGYGAYRYDGKVFTGLTTGQGMMSNVVTAIEEDNAGNLWFGTPGGACSYDGYSITLYTDKQGLANNEVRDIMKDRKGDLWFATYNGVSRYDGKQFTSFSTQHGLASKIVNFIGEGSDGDIWFGTEVGGASRYDGKSFNTYTVDQGLAHNNVARMINDKSGNLWLSTVGGGVSRFDGSSFISFSTAQGLADNFVYDMVEDDEGVIWIGTSQGYSALKFKPKIQANKSGEIKGAGLFSESNEVLKTYEPIWEIYNNKTGYPIKDLNEGAICHVKQDLPNGNEKNKGTLWGACGDEKIIRFDPKAVQKDTAHSPVHIKSVRINESLVNWYSLRPHDGDSALVAQQELLVYGDILPAPVRDSLQKKFTGIRFDSIGTFFQVPYQLILPYKYNHVTIDFGAVETSRNFMVRYQYFLEGYDNEWSPVTEKTSVTYGNINEGTYTFKLKARSPEGIWSDSISYSFKVLPPWWRTWWFRTVMGACFLFLLYGIYRWRTANLHKQKKVLEQTVKERTAELTKQKGKSDELLLNILPSEVAEELKVKGYTTAKTFDEVTVLFSDIKGFTEIAEKMTAQELVKEIDTYFSAFDSIIQEYGLEKIKTIGDAYIAAGGLPEKNAATAQNVVEAAIAMQQAVEELKQERAPLHKPYFELRIGIHTGTVVAGVVGKRKFQYDIWGDTVNLAARMEQSGLPGKINISQHTYELVKEQFTCIPRGKIDAKNKGSIDMYFAG